MSSNNHQATPDLAETWKQFKSARGRELRNWVDAERALAKARQAGAEATDPGDRLLAAEAALQSAIVDFAAALDAASDPTPVALGLLRLAEDALEAEAHGPRPPRTQGPPDVERRRRHQSQS